MIKVGGGMGGLAREGEGKWVVLVGRKRQALNTRQAVKENAITGFVGTPRIATRVRLIHPS